MSAIEQVLQWADDVGVDQELLKRAWADLDYCQRVIERSWEVVETGVDLPWFKLVKFSETLRERKKYYFRRELGEHGFQIT